MAGRNLVNFDRVSKAYGERPLLDDVSLGVGEAERIAVVGRNGAGKSTLLALIAGLVTPDSGRVTVNSGVHVGAVSQAEGFDPQMTVAEYVVPGQDVHQWASDPAIREVLDGLLGGFDEDLLARRLGTMSGGERRRVRQLRTRRGLPPLPRSRRQGAKARDDAPACRGLLPQTGRCEAAALGLAASRWLR